MKYNKPTIEELTYIDSIKTQRKYSRGEQLEMYTVYNRLFNDSRRPSGCGRCVAEVQQSLMKVLRENKIELVEPPKLKRGRPKKEN